MGVCPPVLPLFVLLLLDEPLLVPFPCPDVPLLFVLLLPDVLLLGTVVLLPDPEPSCCFLVYVYPEVVYPLVLIVATTSHMKPVASISTL